MQKPSFDLHLSLALFKETLEKRKLCVQNCYGLKSLLSDVSLLSLPSNLRRNRHFLLLLGFFLLKIPPRLPLPKPAETSSIPNIMLANEGSLNAARKADDFRNSPPFQASDGP